VPALVTIDPVLSDTPPPVSLKEHGRKEWTHVLKTCQWIAKSDLMCLRTYCEILDRRAAFASELEGNSLMLETSTGYAYINPAAVGMKQCEDQLLKWMGILGLSPSDRSNLGVAEVKSMTTLEKLAMARAERAEAEKAEVIDVTPENKNASVPARRPRLKT
jgi:P27 family predicted phage terminase small subunit